MARERERERDRQAGKMKSFDHFKYILFCKDEQWWTPSNWCISNSLLRWISQKLSFRLKFWVFDLLNNQSVKNWLSECLMANVALLETAWVWVRCFSEVIMMRLARAYLSRSGAGRMEWLPLEALGSGAPQASSSPAGRLVCPRAEVTCAGAGSLLPSEWWLWVPPLGLCVHSLPPELKTRADPGASTVAPSQSPRQWTAWPSWLVRPPGPLLCTRCSAWMTAAASRRHGNSLRPSQRGTPPRGWAPPTRLWAPAYGLQPGTRRMKVSPGREGLRQVTDAWLPAFGCPKQRCRRSLFLIELNPSLACQGPLNH